MTGPRPSPATGAQLLDAGELGLGRGESRQAFELLRRAAQVGVDDVHLQRLASAYALAARYLGRHGEVVGWLEEQIAHLPLVPEARLDLSRRAALLRARITAYCQLDVRRVLDHIDEALVAAELAGDESAIASVLSHAAFAAYRRGDPAAAHRWATEAAERTYGSHAAVYDATRARLFAATAAGDLEAALNLSIKCRALARDLGLTAEAAHESNNIAESYLELGCPSEARDCAEQALKLACASGHHAVEAHAGMLAAVATAEIGDLDQALAAFDALRVHGHDRLQAVDAACAHSYWLIERSAAGDVRRAREIALSALTLASDIGVESRLTGLHATIARSYAREGIDDDARAALEAARLVADRATLAAQSLLALAAAEVLPVTEPKRQVVLNHARARVLRAAERREDPHAYCNQVRLNRRLLELSGGVPTDLPRSQ
mgnify:CR=1 FL=1